MNTADYLLEDGQDNNLALVTETSAYTYLDLRTGIQIILNELDQLQVQAGDRVGILGSNSFFWVAAYLAILKMGAIAVPFSTLLPADEFFYLLNWAGCKVLCAQERIYQRLAEKRTVIPLILDQALPGNLGRRVSAASFVERPVMLPHKPATQEEHAQAPEMLAALMFTSGTTSSPRAVMVTHRNLQANTDSILSYLELDSGDRMMVVLPFYYCFGASLLHTHLRAGGSLVLNNRFAFPETVLDHMSITHCTGFAGVPTTYQTLLRNSTFKQREFPDLWKLQQAGGKLMEPLINELCEAMPQAKVYIMYGQTEATARLSYLPPSDLQNKKGSVGCGIPGVKLEVLGEDGQPVSPGEVGEIFASGENISPGYLNDPEETALKMAGGVLHTGDLATIDKDGYIYIVDRKSDFIKSSGYRVSSQQVEACLQELPQVTSVAVVGVPDTVQGEAIVAFVTIQAGAEFNSEDAIYHCRQRLARYMVPARVLQVTSLPLNAHGKVQKNELRKLAVQV